MDNVTKFKHLKHICLKHYGESYLLGVSPDGICYVEEYYDDSFVAQHEISADGLIIRSADEDHGRATYRSLTMPPEMSVPDRPDQHMLNHTGFRDRGLREVEKVQEWVQPLPIMEKLPLLQALKISSPPMMILGIAESKVLSQAAISAHEVLVCRRIKLLRALPEVQFDTAGLPYDYDTVICHALQFYNPATDSASSLHLAPQRFAPVMNPSDVILHNARLYVTENSNGPDVSAVHIFEADELIR